MRYRLNGKSTDGAYAFTVEIARYKSVATPVHDPLYSPVENFAHVEVRELADGESIFSEPPHGRKKKSGKAKRLEYRQNLLNALQVELEPVQST